MRGFHRARELLSAPTSVTPAKPIPPAVVLRLPSAMPRARAQRFAMVVRPTRTQDGAITSCVWALRRRPGRGHAA
jgi:hypothetical protein